MKKKLVLASALLVLACLVPLAIVLAQGGGIADPYEGYDSLDNPYGPLLLGPQYAAYHYNANDVDFYYFDVNEVGTIQVDLTNVPPAYTYGLILYDRDKEIVNLDVQGKGDKRLEFQMSRKGRYYLLVDVRAGGYDAYQPYLLRVTTYQGGISREPVAGTDSYEDNNTYQTAYGPPVSDQTYEAYVMSRGDRDCYYFTLSRPASVKVALTNLCPECDYELYLVDTAERILAASENSAGVDENISSNLSPGTYYLVVHPYQNYSDTIPYRLVVTYEETTGTRQGPLPGEEAAWAQARLQELGYDVPNEPGVLEMADGTRAVVALEEPRSLDLRLSDDATWKQAVDTWGVLINAFDVHQLWIGLNYQGLYMIYYVVESAEFGRYINGDVSREDMTVYMGVWDMRAGEWMSNARDFIDKSFQ